MIFFKSESTDMNDTYSSITIEERPSICFYVSCSREFHMFNSNRNCNDLMFLSRESFREITGRRVTYRYYFVGKAKKKAVPDSLRERFYIQADSAGVSKNDWLFPTKKDF